MTSIVWKTSYSLVESYESQLRKVKPVRLVACELSGLPAEIRAVVKGNLASAIWGQNCLATIMVALPCLHLFFTPPLQSA